VPVRGREKNVVDAFPKKNLSRLSAGVYLSQPARNEARSGEREERVRSTKGVSKQRMLEVGRRFAEKRPSSTTLIDGNGNQRLSAPVGDGVREKRENVAIWKISGKNRKGTWLL